MATKNKPPLTLADMEGLKNDRGLVPMLVTRGHAPYFEGTIAGFSPKKALEEYNGGRMIPEKLKDQILNDATPAKAPPKPTREAKIGVSLEKVQRQLATKLTDKPEPSTVSIPENWETKEYGHLNRIRLAKALTGKTKEKGLKMNDADAIAIIKAEAEKRASSAPSE